MISKPIFLEGQHDYDLRIKKTKKGTKYTLIYNSDTKWCNPNVKIMSIFDDGNGYKVKSKFFKGRVDYDEMLELFTILKHINL